MLDKGKEAVLTAEHVGTKEKINFSNDISFSSVDGNFEILTNEDRRFTRDDVKNGLLSVQDKADQSVARLLQDLTDQLQDPGREMPAERKSTVEYLRSGKPVFIELDPDKINPAFVQAVGLFIGAKPGVILLPVAESSIFRIAALQNNNGEYARVLKGLMPEDLDGFTKGINQLTPPVDAKKINDTEVVYCMEFVRNAQRPTKISQTEMDDWLQRSEQSNLIFSFDVGENDRCLDNFVRKGGKIYWVDGNILDAKLAKTPEELSAFIALQKHILGNYLE